MAGMTLKGKPQKKQSPGQMKLPWDDWVADNPEICQVAERFILANCYDPALALQILERTPVPGND
jgi:putative transposase